MFPLPACQWFLGFLARSASSGLCCSGVWFSSSSGRFLFWGASFLCGHRPEDQSGPFRYPLYSDRVCSYCALLHILYWAFWEGLEFRCSSVVVAVRVRGSSSWWCVSEMSISKARSPLIPRQQHYVSLLSRLPLQIWLQDVLRGSSLHETYMCVCVLNSSDEPNLPDPWFWFSYVTGRM